jgi:hypothetical protein
MPETSQDERVEEKQAATSGLPEGITRVTSEQLHAVAEKVARRRSGLFERLAR